MVDVENEVFTKVATALRNAFPGIDVKSTLELLPTVFPCACIEEISSAAYRNSIDSGSNENHADVTYEVNIYSNSPTAGKSECKAILKVVDDCFQRMGFIRMSKLPIRMNDATKYRFRATYRGVVSKNHTVYRR